MPETDILWGVLLLVCALSLHGRVFRVTDSFGWSAELKDATRYPGLGLCFTFPFWFWSRHATGSVFLEVALLSFTFFFVGAVVLEMASRLAVVRGRPRMRELGYTFLFLLSFGMALWLKQEPSGLLLPLLYTAILYWSLNLLRLVTWRATEGARPPWNVVRGSLGPWLYPLVASAGAYYLVYEWNFAAPGSGAHMHSRLLLQVLTLAAVGDSLIAVGFHFRAPKDWKEGPWVRDVCRSLLYLGLAWNYYTWASGHSLADLLVGSAFVSVGLGFALRPTLGNFAAGLVLQLSPPFAIGDFLQIGTQLGWVHSIDWRSTSLRTLAADLIVFPNAVVAQKMLVNFSAPSREHACSSFVLLDGSTEPGKVIQIILDILAVHPPILQDPISEVYLHEFTGHGVMYRVKYWIHDISFSPQLESGVNNHLAYGLRRAGLEPLKPIRHALI